MADLRGAAAYIAWRDGCVHPFRISRILVLANWRAVEEGRAPIARFSVEGFEAGFAVPELEELKTGDPCFKADLERRCLRYSCGRPELEEWEERILEEILGEYGSLGDAELNRRVIRDPRYKELLEAGGFV